MYRLQAALVLFMAAVSVLGYFIVPAKSASDSVELEPASSVHSAQWPSRSAEFVSQQKLIVRDQLLSKTSASKPNSTLTMLSEFDNVAYGILEQNKSYWLVTLGEKCPARYWPKVTLRIWKSGQIDEQTSAGEWQTISR